MRRRLSIAALIAAALFLWPLSAESKSYKGRTVKVIRTSGRPLVGKVIRESPQEIEIQTPYGPVKIARGTIKEIIDAQAIVEEHAKRGKACKSGEDWYQLALWARKQNLPLKTIRDDFEKAIEVDPNHEKSREELGFYKTPNGRGGFDWVRRTEKGDREDIADEILKAKAAIAERPWDENEIILKYPPSNPVYAVYTNCPKEVGEEYASFLVKLKDGLVKAVAKVYPKPIPFQNKGLSKVFICNSQQLFMEITGMSPGIGGFYMPGYFAPGDDDKVVVAFHGTFGASGNTYEVLAHEGTHQLQGLMWKGSFGNRAQWFIEGLAVYFGDGHYVDRSGKFGVRIPRDRLNQLLRQMKANRSYPLSRVMYRSPAERSQGFPGAFYAYGWSIIYWMLHSGESIKINGKDEPLKDIFGRYFEANLGRGVADIGQFMGARNREQSMALVTRLQDQWKRYIQGLKPPSVGEFDAKNSRRFISEALGFEYTAPRGRRKQGWQYIDEIQLKNGELLAVEQPETTARFSISQQANVRIETEVDNLARDVLQSQAQGYTDFKFIKREKLTFRGQPVLGLSFSGKERGDNGEDAHPNPVRVRVLVYLAGEQFYLLTCRADKARWKDAEAQLEEAYKGFSVLVR